MSDVKFPLAIYRRGSLPDQIDHPGWLSKVVQDAAALDAAHADGWHVGMVDPVKPAPAISEPSDWPLPEPAPEFNQEPPPGWVGPSAPTRSGRKRKSAD